MENIWKKYRAIVFRNILGETQTKDLAYWRNRMFAETVTFLLPLCIIAVSTGIYWAIKRGVAFIIVLDLLLIITFVYITLVPGVQVKHRKRILVYSGYFMAVVLLYLVGPSGPGLIYLYACCVFGIFFFANNYAYLFATINTVICLVVGLLIIQGIVPTGMDKGVEGLIEWITLSSNIIFLSFLSAALIPGVFAGLQQTLKEEITLSKQLEAEQKSLEKANLLLQAKNADLEQFTYVASHDLREPLRMVTGFLGQLERKYESGIDEKGRTYIRYAVDGAKRMHTLIGDLLQFSRAGKTEGMQELTDTNILVGEVLLLLKEKTEEQNATINIGALPQITTLPSALRQVFQNLVDNALKYHKKDQPPHIDISAISQGNYWKFTVADNGIGIAPEYHNRIFIIFQKLHNREEYTGTGIGLAICKKMIEMLNGKIWVESEEGRGARFHFILPAVPLNDS